MNFSRIGLFVFLLLGIALQANAQSLDLFSFQKKPTYHTNFAVILYDGKPIVKEGDGPLTLDFGNRGILSVATINRTTKEVLPTEPIGFKVGVRDYKSNTRWMYSEKTFYELDLNKLIINADMGYELFFMVVDRKYSLSRNAVLVMDGC